MDEEDGVQFAQYGEENNKVVKNKQSTYDISSGVPDWEPPIVCAKLVIGPLPGLCPPKPVLPIGTPAPKAQVAALLPTQVELSAIIHMIIRSTRNPTHLSTWR